MTLSRAAAAVTASRGPENPIRDHEDFALSAWLSSPETTLSPTGFTVP